MASIELPVAVKINGEWVEVGKVDIPVTVQTARPGMLRGATETGGHHG